MCKYPKLNCVRNQYHVIDTDRISRNFSALPITLEERLQIEAVIQQSIRQFFINLQNSAALKEVLVVMLQFNNTPSNSMNSTNQTPVNSASPDSEDTRLYKYILRWLPKPKRWLYIGWFGGLQIYTKK